MRQIVISFLIDNIMVLCIYLLYVFGVVKYKNLAYVLFKMEDSKEGKIVTVIMGMLLLYLFVTFTVPSIKDVPYIVENKYIEVSGRALKDSSKDSRGIARNLFIVGEEEEQIKVELCGECDDINIGDEVKVIYLPNTAYGYVVEHKTISD